VATNGARRFVYQYNGQEKSEEVEDRPTDGMETPNIGSLISRNGKEWLVVHVIAPVSSSGTIPVVRVFLNDTTRFKPRMPAVRHLPK
jgi:hypothetical protein